MYDILSEEIKKLNGQIRIVPVDILQTLESDVYDVKKGEYGSDLIDQIINDFFSFGTPELSFRARSIIVVAMPKPYVMVRFNFKGKSYSFYNEDFLPYTNNSDIVEKVISEILNPKGYNIKETGSLPMKPLAVRSGLSLYGRNNVTYVKGMGSLVTLKAFFSDIECDSSTISDIKRMDICKQCTLCLNNCPTGAIIADRKIIKAERCLTYLNEFIDAEGFPDWLLSIAHNSLHGCIICQSVCPMNKPYLNNIETPVEFDEQETLELLNGVSKNSLSQSTLSKIKLLCLEDYLPLLPRNLSALIF